MLYYVDSIGTNKNFTQDGLFLKKFVIIEAPHLLLCMWLRVVKELEGG